MPDYAAGYAEVELLAAAEATRLQTVWLVQGPVKLTLAVAGLTYLREHLSLAALPEGAEAGVAEERVQLSLLAGVAEGQLSLPRAPGSAARLAVVLGHDSASWNHQ